ncbi:MAG: methyl-accepting chemotaxis protein [Anaerolineae bacterium]|nr:methyl-accepting chemotaxis protein [Anaerolineae bacterium]
MNATAVNNTKIPIYRSLQSHLTLWFLLLGLVPLIVLGVLSLVNANNALKDSIDSTLNGLAETKAHHLNHWFAHSKNIAESLADSPALRGERTSSMIGVNVISRTRNEIESVDIYTSAHSLALDTMRSYADTFEEVDAAFLTDASGTVVVSTNEELVPEGTSLSEIPTIDLERGMQSTYLSDIFLSIDGVTKIFVVGTPIKDQSGKSIGMLAIRTKLDALNDITQDYTGLGQTGESYLVNIDDKLMRTTSRFIQDTVLSQMVDTYPVAQAIDGVTEGNGIYLDYRGEEVLGVWHILEESDLLLLTEIDSSEAYAPAAELSRTVLIIIVVVAVILNIVSIWISRSISKPILTIIKSATQVASGELDVQVKIPHKNELGVLAAAFNQMTENIRSLVEAERRNTKHLQKTVTEYSHFVEKVSEGDLTARLDLTEAYKDTVNSQNDLYTLGLHLTNMVDNLRGMATQVREAASSVSSAATQIQAAATQQSASATEQDAAVTQTVATVEEVRATVMQTSERAQSVADVSQQSVQVSRNGQQAVTDTVQGMDIIRERVESIAENILMLSERTQQIGEIIDTVNALADQSKLLALNASIEAARAGEEGKGFAVVAMEVRQLAEQSRQSTGRVRNILNEIQQATNTAVMVTEEGSKGAESGMTMAQRAGESIRELAATIEEASQSALQIAASTHQQTNGMDQLAAAMAQIRQATAQTVASARQTEQGVHDLTEMAKRLELAAARYSL